MPSMNNFVVEWERFIVVILATIVLLVPFHYVIMCWYTRKELKRAPSPFPSWPIVGHLPLLVGKISHRVFYTLSKTYGDIMELKLGSIRAIVISSPKMAKEVLKIHDLVFASRPKFINSQITSYNGHSLAWAPYGDYWRHARKVKVLALFTAQRIDDSKNVRHEELSFLIQRIFEDCKGEKLLNMQKMLHRAGLTLLTRLLFRNTYFTTKLSSEECEEFKDIIIEQSSLIGSFNISDYIPCLKPFDLQGLRHHMNQVHLKVDKFLDKFIGDHRNEKRLDNSKDFFDILLSLSETNNNSNETFNDNKLKAILNEGLMAGSETFTTTVEWAFVELLKHPEVMKKAQDELDDVVGHQRIVDEKDVPQLKYLQAIVKETFRLHPPVPTLIPHENFESCEVGGYHVNAKSMILVNLWAIHRDPCAYENPLDFNPERFIGSVIDVKGNDFQLLPFGSGRRICPALSLGLIMVQIYLARLLHSFVWKLPKEENIEELDMTEKTSLTAPKAIPLQVIPNARLPFHLYVT